MVSVVLYSIFLLTSLLLIPWVFGEFTAYQVGLYLIFGMAAQGVGFLWGKTGILPLGQALFFGICAYFTGQILLAVDSLLLQLGLIVLVVLLISLLAMLLATVIFRGKSDSGPYFSLLTLALVMFAEQIANTSVNLTGGFNGLTGFDTIGGLDSFGNFYYVVIIIVVLFTAVLLFLDKRPAGLILRAIQDNEPRLQLMGFKTHLLKGYAFGFAALLAAVAGALYVNHQGIVTPFAIGFSLSTQLVVWTAVGGRFHPLGALLGAVIIGFLSAEMRDHFRYWEIFIAVVFIFVVFKAPGGFWELLEKAFNYFKKHSNTITAPNFELRADKSTNQQTAKSIIFEQVHVSVGSVNILNGVDFATDKAGILSIIGPNGAGKSSLLNVITGNLKVTDGKVLLGEQSIQNRPVYRALRDGIGRKLQIPSIFATLSVAENHAIAHLANFATGSDYFRLATLQWQSPVVNNILNSYPLPFQDCWHLTAQELPQGHRQFLEFIMTIAAQPKIILLDEPCAGLSPHETHLMMQLVQQFQQQTQSLIIMIEHDMAIVESISDKVLVLHQGKVIAYDSYQNIQQNPAVSAVYSGGTK